MRGSVPYGALAAFALFVMLSGCTGSDEGNAAPTPSASGSGEPSASGQPWGALSGGVLQDFSCEVPTGRLPLVTVTGEPEELMICGPSTKGGDPPLGGGAVLSPEAGESFTQLLDALSLPDVKAQQDRPCPAIAVFVPQVVLRTSTGVWLVHVPEGVCGPRQQVLKLLRATAGW